MIRLEMRPGVKGVHVTPSGNRFPVAECASCGEVRPIKRRGLCGPCKWRHEGDGTVREYGWTKADRVSEYSALRQSLAVAGAAARLGISLRTAERYEAERREHAAALAPACSLQGSLLT